MSDRPDDADVLAAVERVTEALAANPDRRKDWPAAAHAYDLCHLYDGRERSAEARARAHAKVLVAGRLLRRVEFSGHIGWVLTPAGSALAQDGVIRCDECRTPALAAPLTDRRPRCAEHEAQGLEREAGEQDRMAEWGREMAERHEADAARLRARAEELRGH